MPFEPVFEAMCAAAAEIMRESRSAGRELVAVSVSIGGPLDITAGLIFSPPNLPMWDRIPLKSRLRERFGLPVYIEHDGNAGALAEWTFGAGVGTRNMIFLTLGTGLGAGLILNGAIHRGSTDTAGEVGHIRLAEAGPVAYGKSGSWEGLCSGAGLARLAHLRYPRRWAEDAAPRAIISDALGGVPEAVALVEEMGEHLGRGVAILVDILNPQLVVVGTLGAVLGDLLLAPARRWLALEALPISAQACQIVPAQLGDSLGQTAALMAAIDARRHPV
jgi:glucokinase